MAATLRQFAKWLGGDASPEEELQVEKSLGEPDGALTQSLRRLESLVTRYCPRPVPGSAGDEVVHSWIQDELALLLGDPQSVLSFVLSNNRVLVNELFIRYDRSEFSGRVASENFYQLAATAVRTCLVDQASRAIRQPSTRASTVIGGNAGETLANAANPSNETLFGGEPTVAFSRACPEATLAQNEKWSKLFLDSPSLYEIYALAEFAGRSPGEVAGILGLTEVQAVDRHILAELLLKEADGIPLER